MVSEGQQFPAGPKPLRAWRRAVLILGILSVLTAVAVGGLRKWRTLGPSPPAPVDEDPRRTFITPFHNVRPEVAYVDDQVCADCHAGHASRFRRHPMGRSLTRVDQAETLERYGADSYNPFQALGATFQVKHRDG